MSIEASVIECLKTRLLRAAERLLVGKNSALTRFEAELAAAAAGLGLVAELEASTPYVWQLAATMGGGEALSKLDERAEALVSRWASQWQGEPSISSSRPLSRQLHQESEILRVICDLGFEPKRLPTNVPGKPGIKAQVYAVLGQPTQRVDVLRPAPSRTDAQKMTRGVFDKAWERLRASGEITGG